MIDYDQRLVERKLNHLSRYLLLLKAKSSLAQEAFLTDTDQQLATERLIQLLVEIASDLSGHLIVAQGGEAPASYRDSFRKLGEMNILSWELTESLMLAAGMRNRLVHEYEDIDLLVVFETIPIAVEIFTQFIRATNHFRDPDNALPSPS